MPLFAAAACCGSEFIGHAGADFLNIGTEFEPVKSSFLILGVAVFGTSNQMSAKTVFNAAADCVTGICPCGRRAVRLTGNIDACPQFGLADRNARCRKNKDVVEGVTHSGAHRSSDLLVEFNSGCSDNICISALVI